MAHHQKYEQGNTRPHQLLLKRCPSFWKRDFREKGGERFDEVEKSYYCTKVNQLQIILKLKKERQNILPLMIAICDGSGYYKL